MNRKELQHLLSRAAFGMSVEHMKKFEGLSRSEVLNQLFDNSKSVTPLNIDLTDFFSKAEKISLSNRKDLRKLVESIRKKSIELNNLWLNGILNGKQELRERMLLFWANHFVCKDSNVYHMELYLNTLKKHALGNFGDFVKDVSKQASMLKYLNGKQNRKASPNENFARELMELFTLGEGHYSEKDIRECARAFTGYNHNFYGEFMMRRFQHDSGRKYFLEYSGYYSGDDVIDIILEQKQCAKFMCSKIYRYFVNPIPNEERINELAGVFHQDYEISKLLWYLFNQDWFYNSENIGVKIKSPIDLLVSAHRIWPYKFEDDKAYFKIQKLLGQTLLDPPNVAGWSGDKDWIDTNTLMIRLKLPSLIYGINLQNGSSVGGFRGRKKNPFMAEVDSEYLIENYKDFNSTEVSEFVLSSHINRRSFSDYIDPMSKRLTAVRLMSLPEFQLS